MPKLAFTREDLLAGMIVRPDWYPLEVVKIEEKDKKQDQDGSLNVFALMKITSGEFEGVQVYQYLYNTKAPVFVIPFVKAIMGVEELSEGDEFDISDATCKGKQIDGMLINEEYNNKPQNKIVDFAPLGKFAS